MFCDLSDEIVDKYIPDNAPQDQWDIDGALNEFFDSFTYVNIQLDITMKMNSDGIIFS